MCSSVPRALALSVQLIGSVGLCRAVETPSTALAGLHANAAVCQARLHPSYQVFVAQARQARLPEIKLLDNRVLSVGPSSKLDFGKPDPGTSGEKIALAEQLQVPTEFLKGLVQNLSAKQLRGEELAQEFQTAVIDCRYLAERLARYRPTARGEAVKAAALNCLQAGDLQKAWQIFVDLPKPLPPSGLRITSVSPASK
jgi:hypothetical protein